MPSGMSRRSAAAAVVAAAAVHETHHPDGKGPQHQSSASLAEYSAALGRITRGALDGLTFTHLPPLFAGTTALFAVGVRESRLWLRPTAQTSAWTTRWHFMGAYGMAQLVPSLIPQTQPASILARRVGLPRELIFDGGDVLLKERPERYLRFVRSVSFRAAIAGSILLSQVVSLVNILMDAQEDYVDRIWKGQEPPLDVSRRSSWFDSSTDDSSGIVRRLLHGTNHCHSHPGVVVRLAGETSDVTTQSLALEGRSRIFPIFEKPELHNVETAVKTHGGGGNDPLIPVYWRVANGRYGRADSWRDLTIPQSWLHDVTPTASRVRTGRPNKMLILEADATSGDADSMSLGRKRSSDLDLDLYEVEQGFYHLECCVDAPADEFESMRVLLVDPETSVEKGGGFSQMANDYVRDLDLCDVVIDARRPLTLAMTTWLESVDTDHISCGGCQSKGGILSSAGEKLAHLLGRKRLRPVILWTPSESWFQSMRQELEPLGYGIISYTEALRQYGREGAEHLPMLVYEKTLSDSVHTCGRLVEKGRTCKETVCALFPQHFNKNRGEEEHRFASLCSTSLYNQLFLWVRERALEGWNSVEIQARLDDNLQGILAELVAAGKLAQGQEWVQRAALQQKERRR